MILDLLKTKCPNCRKEKIFSYSNPYNLKHSGKMPDNCPNCGQDFVVEPGFYFGAAYVSYALNVGWLLSAFLFLYFGLHWERQSIVIFVVIATLISFPVIFRLSRTMWLYSYYFINRKSE